MKQEHTSGASKYGGMSKRQYKKQKAKKSSEPGLKKGEACRATSLDKALAIYPRAYKTMPVLYIAFNKKKDKAANRERTFFTDL